MFASDPFDNSRLVRSLLMTGVVTILATELSFLQQWLLTTSLDARQWGACLLGALVVVAVDELRKAVERSRGHHDGRPAVSTAA